MEKEDDNPFLVSGYKSELFCDRQNEVSALLRFAVNGVNTTLLSVRRMGKTGLLRHTLEQLKKEKKGIGIYMDIYDTGNLRDFVNRLTTSMLEEIHPGEPFFKKVMEFIKGMRPVITYDELTGQPEVSLDYRQPKQYEYTLRGILSFLEKRNKLILIAIDEFQQIAQYPEKNMESVLRTQIQPLKNVRFIFSGSSPHLLTRMFHHTNRPFFSSAQSIELNEIPESEYSKFITRQFALHKRIIEEEAVEFILHFTYRHTYYTQALCNFIFSKNLKKVQKKDAQLAAYVLLKQNEGIYYQYRTMLTDNQWAMLKAIAGEEYMYHPNSKEILQKYALGSSSLVQRVMEALLNKEMIYSKEGKSGKYYRVYDCFFSRWLERH
jgi:AAA+ ATPase superfamily predicted ATPase